MTTRRVLDVVFCLDASASMQPCIDSVRAHIGDFLAGLTSANSQAQWDWRVDFVAHSAGQIGTQIDQIVFDFRSLFEESSAQLIDSLYKPQTSGRFFTRDLDEFRRGLAALATNGDETPLVALDCCLDFPWREAAQCHRVVIMLTDEAFETGIYQSEQLALLPKLVRKIQSLRVLLYLVAPESSAFNKLAEVEKSEYETVDLVGNGLVGVDFKLLLTQIGKSVSVSTNQGITKGIEERGLFGQARWGAITQPVTIRGS